MKKINLLYLLAILAIISGLLLYYLPDMTSGHNAESNNTSQTFKEKTIVHDFGTTKLKKVPKRIVILDNLYGEILNPLDITPVGATTGQADSQEFSTLFKKQYKDAKVVSVGWQGSPDLDKIAELKPDLSNLKDSVVYASKSSSFTVQKLGAFPSIPTRDVVEQALKEN
ncbi:MAG: hypothetical protein KHX57_07745 [Streptococcus sp.]|nr:hypothetical protein [Streptococcus sp.]MBS5424898.1 hypothetical protein [Streptococcus sp.]